MQVLPAEVLAKRYDAGINDGDWVEDAYKWAGVLFEDELSKETVAQFLTVANTIDAVKGAIISLSPQARAAFGFVVPYCGGSMPPAGAIVSGHSAYQTLVEWADTANRFAWRNFALAMVTPVAVNGGVVRPIDELTSILRKPTFDRAGQQDLALKNYFKEELVLGTLSDFIRTVNPNRVLSTAVKSVWFQNRKLLGLTVIPDIEPTTVVVPPPTVTRPRTVVVPPPTITRPTVVVPPPTVTRPSMFVPPPPVFGAQ